GREAECANQSNPERAGDPAEAQDDRVRSDLQDPGRGGGLFQERSRELGQDDPRDRHHRRLMAVAAGWVERRSILPRPRTHMRETQQSRMRIDVGSRKCSTQPTAPPHAAILPWTAIAKLTKASRINRCR